MSYSYDFNSLIPSKYLEEELDFEAVTADVEYQDGGKNFAENSTTFPRRWLFEYDSLTQLQAAAIDAVYNTYRLANSFTFTDKSGAVHTNCYFERFNKNHDGHKSWIQKRRFIIVKYNAPIPAAPDVIVPAVSITSHINGDDISGIEVFTATATDNVNVSSVKFYFGANLLGSATNTSGSTWSLSVDISAYEGTTQSLTAVAEDTASPANAATSAAVSVDIVEAPVGGSTIRIHCGGGSAVGDYSADQYYSGGTTPTRAETINSGGVTNPPPDSVYLTFRAALPGSITYTIPVASGFTYTVRLHNYHDANGPNVYKNDVAINGTQQINDWDPHSTGSVGDANVQEITGVSPNGSNNIVIAFTSDTTGNTKISAIEILPE